MTENEKEKIGPLEVFHNQMMEARISELKIASKDDPLIFDAVCSVEKIHKEVQGLPLARWRQTFGIISFLALNKPDEITRILDLLRRHLASQITKILPVKISSSGFQVGKMIDLNQTGAFGPVDLADPGDPGDPTLNLMDADGNKLKLSDLLREG